MLLGPYGPGLLGSIAASQNCTLTFCGSKLLTLRCLQPCISGLTAQPSAALLDPFIHCSVKASSGVVQMCAAMLLMQAGSALSSEVITISRDDKA